MRAIINTIWICFFLLVGGQDLHADTSACAINDFSSFTFFKNEQVKLKKAEPCSFLIEELSVDLDEEFHSSDDLKADNSNKFIVTKNGLLDNWFLTISNTLLLKVSTKQFESLIPNCGYSNPIYLRIGVLRI